MVYFILFTLFPPFVSHLQMNSACKWTVHVHEYQQATVLQQASTLVAQWV